VPVVVQKQRVNNPYESIQCIFAVSLVADKVLLRGVSSHHRSSLAPRLLQLTARACHVGNSS
jgi:hypothetical protein